MQCHVVFLHLSYFACLSVWRTSASSSFHEMDSELRSYELRNEVHQVGKPLMLPVDPDFRDRGSLPVYTPNNVHDMSYIQYTI